MAFGSYRSRVLHTRLRKPSVPQSSGYTGPSVVEVVGFHCSHRRGASPAAEVLGKGDGAQGAAPSLRVSSLGPRSPQTKDLSHFLAKE